MAPPIKNWVPFHESLTLGHKRDMSRATRFIFMEICLKARAFEGFIEVSSKMEIVDALADLLGGDRTELVVAEAELFHGDDAMLSLRREGGRTFVDVPSWASWRPGKSSAERTERSRATKKLDGIGCGVTNNDYATAISLLFSSEPGVNSDVREDAEQCKEVVRVVDKCDHMSEVRKILEFSRDLWPEETSKSLDGMASRMCEAVKNEPAVRGEPARHLVTEAVAIARKYKAKFAAATSATIAAHAEEALVKYVLGGARAGERKKYAVKPVAPAKISLNERGQQIYGKICDYRELVFPGADDKDLAKAAKYCESASAAVPDFDMNGCVDGAVAWLMKLLTDEPEMPMNRRFQLFCVSVAGIIRRKAGIASGRQ